MFEKRQPRLGLQLELFPVTFRRSAGRLTWPRCAHWSTAQISRWGKMKSQAGWRQLHSAVFFFKCLWTWVLRCWCGFVRKWWNTTKWSISGLVSARLHEAFAAGYDSTTRKMFRNRRSCWWNLKMCWKFTHSWWYMYIIYTRCIVIFINIHISYPA